MSHASSMIVFDPARQAVRTAAVSAMSNSFWRSWYVSQIGAAFGLTVFTTISLAAA
jgi:hypothetical protein